VSARASSADPLLKLLRESDPVEKDRLAAPQVERALDAIAAGVVLTAPAKHGRSISRRWKIAAVALAAAAIITGVASAAGVFSAHTGLYPSSTEISPGGPGEELNPAAPDFRSVALTVSADIPYPHAFSSWRDWVLSEQVGTMRGAGDGGPFPSGLVSTGALRGWFAASAFCAWVQDWREATVTGNTSEAAAAAQTIQAAPSWKAVIAEDPNPSPSQPNDPSAEPGTLFGWMLPYRSAVLAGDSGHVENLLANGYGNGRCWLADPQWMAQQKHWSQLSPSELAARYKQFLASERS
jgi:hypothetical protein